MKGRAGCCARAALSNHLDGGSTNSYDRSACERQHYRPAWPFLRLPSPPCNCLAASWPRHQCDSLSPGSLNHARQPRDMGAETAIQPAAGDQPQSRHSGFPSWCFSFRLPPTIPPGHRIRHSDARLVVLSIGPLPCFGCAKRALVSWQASLVLKDAGFFDPDSWGRIADESARCLQRSGFQRQIGEVKPTVPRY